MTPAFSSICVCTLAIVASLYITHLCVLEEFHFSFKTTTKTTKNKVFYFEVYAKLAI